MAGGRWEEAIQIDMIEIITATSLVGGNNADVLIWFYQSNISHGYVSFLRETLHINT